MRLQPQKVHLSSIIYLSIIYSKGTQFIYQLFIYHLFIYHLFNLVIYSSIIYSSIIYSSIIYSSIHLFIYTAGLFFSALRTGCVHLTARLVNNCRKYSAKRAAIKSHVWAHPLRPPNGASWDFIASCAISFFVRLRTGDRGCTNRKPVAERVYAARSLTLKNDRSPERTLSLRRMAKYSLFTIHYSLNWYSLIINHYSLFIIHFPSISPPAVNGCSTVAERLLNGCSTDALRDHVLTSLWLSTNYIVRWPHLVGQG